MREDPSQISGCNVHVVGDMEQQAGVDAVTMREKPWIVGGVLEMPKDAGVRWSGEDQHRLRGGVLCERVERQMQRTQDAWMPRPSGVTVNDKFKELQVGAVDDNEEADIAAVSDEANDGVVRVTVDSGVARSVWPKRE